MLSGRKALNNIDRSLQSVRGEAVRLDQQLSRISGQVASGQRQRLNLLNQIAKVRLSEIENGELEAEFNSADAQAVQLLEQRDKAIAQLYSKIGAFNESLEGDERLREKILQECNSVSDELVKIEANVQAELKLSRSYIDHFNAAQAAEAMSDEAERKVERASADMAEKAKPFKNDSLFMYLWNQGFGTTQYKGGLLARFMDSWVARVIRYEPARVNYWNLQEIPKRLIEHADRVGDAADQKMLSLQQLEQDALKVAGAHELELKLEQSRARLDAQDDVIEETEAFLNQALSERATFSSGADDFIRKCLSRISSALEHQNLASIHRYVRQTHSPIDDKLVVELQELEDSLSSLKGDMSGVRRLHDGQINRLRELENVRHQFKNSRFDDVRSGFSNEELISSVLAQFIQGVVSGADLWGTIKRNQRYRNGGSSPDFGSGGLGDLADVLGDSGIDIGDILGGPSPRRRRQRRGSTWHLPKPRRSGGGFQFPRSTNRGGGGFKTGGGF